MVGKGAVSEGAPPEDWGGVGGLEEAAGGN